MRRLSGDIAEKLRRSGGEDAEAFGEDFIS